MSIIGKEIFKSGKSSLGPLSPNHLIYTRGFVIGGRQLTPSPEKSSSKEKNSKRNGITVKTEDDGGAS